MKAYVPCDRCSYYQVALYEGYDITFNIFDADVCIDDPIRFFKRIKYIKDEVKCTLWGDTVYNALYYRNDLVDYDKFIVPSYWNFEMFTKVHTLSYKNTRWHFCVNCPSAVARS